jgi:hypothetical protein
MVLIGQNKMKIWATINLVKVCNSNVVGNLHTYIITVTKATDRMRRFLANKTDYHFILFNMIDLQPVYHPHILSLSYCAT